MTFSTMSKLWMTMAGFTLTFYFGPLSWASLLRDVELHHHVLTTTRQSSLMDCSAACLVDTCCLSFNFFRPTLECQLNFRTKEQNPGDFVPKKGSFYRNKDEITPSIAGICGVNSCQSFERCHTFIEHNEKKCYLRDSKDTTLHITYSPPADNMTHNCYDVMTFHPCSGSYTLTASEVNNVTVYCDMKTQSGGWLVFQRRMDGSVDFYRNWNEYKDGFGDVNREFWLGNEIIHQITNRATYELRVDLEDFDGNTSYAVYSSFSLASKAENYTLQLGNYSGNAGDSLSYSVEFPFSTKDVDLDAYETNCAVIFHGAWWYNMCHRSNLNGLYLAGPTSIFAKGICWSTWRGQYYSLKRTEMKIRPIPI